MRNQPSILKGAPTMDTYSTIPDTSDSAYWVMKEENGAAKYSVFVPRDKARHKQLLKKQRDLLQAEVVRWQQQRRGRQSTLNTNRATWGLNADRATPGSVGSASQIVTRVISRSL